MVKLIISCYRSYEDVIALLHSTNVEVGDINHSHAFPPLVVDAMYNVMTENLRDVFKKFKFPFAMPVSVICDKDRSSLL